MQSVLKVLVIMAMALGWSTGCVLAGDPAVGSSAAEAAAPVDQVQQAVTGCELDCPGGQVLTCSAPCSVPDGNTIICNGVTSHCSCVPQGCDGACGLQSDGCGGVIDCGSCDPPPECPIGKVDCCGDGVCVSPALCHKLVLQGTC